MVALPGLTLDPCPNSSLDSVNRETLRARPSFFSSSSGPRASFRVSVLGNGQSIASSISSGYFRCRNQSSTVTRAKFQEFESKFEISGEEAVEEDPSGSEKPRDDDILPGDLEGAIGQASQAAASFCSSGGTRAIVELSLPDLSSNLSEEGAQQRVWDAAGSFLEALKREAGVETVRAVFTDAGTAARLQHQWQDSSILFSSLNDRRIVFPDDELVVLVSPDYQQLETVQSIAAQLEDEDGLTKPLLLWNPRFSSGDVGVGLNVRRTRRFFLSSFTTVYSLRPLPNGAIYRNYPGPWNLFVDDPDSPGRFLLWRQQGSKPDAEDIENLAFWDGKDNPLESSGSKAEGSSSGSSSPMGVLSSFFRFMNSLSK